jgi:hypothetical protein
MQYSTVQILRSVLYVGEWSYFCYISGSPAKNRIRRFGWLLNAQFWGWAVHANRIPLPAGRFIHLLNSRVQVKALRRTDPSHFQSPAICMKGDYENSTTKQKKIEIHGVIKTTEEI